jgi:hypothetical protein
MMKPISAEAEKEIRTYLATWWMAVNQQLSAATGNEVQIGREAPVDLLYASEIGQRLVRIARAAEKPAPWSPEAARAVTEDCDAFEAWLNQTPLTHHTPDEFWNTPVGYMVLLARLWAGQDRLISLKEAAGLSGLSLSSLSQRISRGQMQFTRDPFEPNPQRGRRIRLSDLEQFIHEGVVRKPGTAVLPKFALPIQFLAQSPLVPEFPPETVNKE